MTKERKIIVERLRAEGAVAYRLGKSCWSNPYGGLANPDAMRWRDGYDSAAVKELVASTDTEESSCGE